MSEDILKIRDLKVYYPVRKGMMGKVQYVKAVDGVTLNVHKGEVLGIVGESGCGKSTLGKAVCKLIPVTDGEIELNGLEIAKMNEKDLRPHRKEIQMIFQDPYASLNPRMTVHDIMPSRWRSITCIPQKRKWTPRSSSFSTRSVLMTTMPSAIRMNSPAARGSESALPEPLRQNRT